MASYNDVYHQQLGDAGLKSAAVIVPLLMELIAPRSVVDVGCGNGAWLSSFKRNGVTEVLGIDGVWAADSLVDGLENSFIPHDLTTPIDLERRFDMAVSLEVAEHLPASSAESFVEILVRLSQVVYFSAAIPLQGGTDHLNEQWPDYWIERFASHGYELFDVVRPRIWDNDNVAYYYAQNSFLFVHNSATVFKSLRGKDTSLFTPKPIRIVHPVSYERKAKQAMRFSGDELSKLGCRLLLSAFVAAVFSAFRRRIWRRSNQSSDT